MRIAVASEKGGAGKTVTAVHLAYALATQKSKTNPSPKVLLIDGDESTYSAIDWVRTGPEAPFKAVTYEEFDPEIHQADHIILDTKGGEGQNNLLQLAKSFDLLVIPSKPDALNLRALTRMLGPLHAAGVTNYKVLLNDIPPPPSTSGDDAREFLKASKVNLFLWQIPGAAAVEKATLEGVCVRDVKKDRRAKSVWNDFQMIAREILP